MIATMFVLPELEGQIQVGVVGGLCSEEAQRMRGPAGEGKWEVH